MRVISVDLEMNQPSEKIIQIGAICFEPDSGKVIDIFNQLIHPEEKINPTITELTGISDDNVLFAPAIQEAAHKFTQFKIKHQANPIGIVWGAGKSNDVRKIYEQSGTENPFDVRIIDVKGVYQMLANASNSNMRQKVGLKKAIENLGLKWDTNYGLPHNALADAHNTMLIYMTLSKMLKGAYDFKERLNA